jgi:hypothetical protein
MDISTFVAELDSNNTSNVEVIAEQLNQMPIDRALYHLKNDVGLERMLDHHFDDKTFYPKMNLLITRINAFYGFVG